MSRRGLKSIFTFPACTTIVRSEGFVSWGRVLMKSLTSTVLEGASQVYARAVPWGLAEGRVCSIQPRYAFPIATLYNDSCTLCRCPRLPGETVGAVAM